VEFIVLKIYTTFYFSSRRRHTRSKRDWSSDVCSSDLGDLIQGTPFMTHYVKAHSERKNPMIQMMNKIGIDASVIGNHEFNFGKRSQERRVGKECRLWRCSLVSKKE